LSPPREGAAVLFDNIRVECFCEEKLCTARSSLVTVFSLPWHETVIQFIGLDWPCFIVSQRWTFLWKILVKSPFLRKLAPCGRELPGESAAPGTDPLSLTAICRRRGDRQSSFYLSKRRKMYCEPT